METIITRLRRAYGLWRCRRGAHERLAWRSARERPVQITNRATEMLYASGLGTLAKWNGWCLRCGRAVAWASYDPRTPAERRAARTHPY